MSELVEALSDFSEVTWDFEEFWKMENDYDVVHIHWPEYLSFEIESYLNSQDDLSDDLWARVEKCCAYWNQHSTMVYTRHVKAPHSRDDQVFKKLYALVFSYCHAVNHFAEFSIKQFQSFFPENTIKLHQVIPQHKHFSLPNDTDKRQAREALNIPMSSKVLLSFGHVKDNEKALISQVFDAIEGKDKYLLAPGWSVKRRKIGYIRLREWVLKWDQWVASLNRKRRINLGFIPEEEAQLYVNAADVLLIPRTNELFSGNISLGFTYGIVVLGKNNSNIGEILERHGNPTFEVGDSESMKAAVNRAFQFSKDGLGSANKAVADEDWSKEKTTTRYKVFFEEAIKEKQLILDN